VETENSATTGGTAQSAAPALSLGPPEVRGFEYSTTGNFTIFKSNEGHFVLFANDPEKFAQAVEALTLVDLLVEAEEERVYGVLDLKDEEMELLFGQAFLRSHREFVAWQLLTARA
jgi:hypothetical protein